MVEYNGGTISTITGNYRHHYRNPGLQSPTEPTSMSILPLELRSTTDDGKAVAEIDRALRAARKRIARRQTIAVAVSTLAAPIAAAALWIGVSRFTLLSLPQWPTAAFLLLWLALVAGVALTHNITVGQCARYLDRTLALDERLTTVLELARSTPLRSLSAKPAILPASLLQDTAFQVKARRHTLPGIWSFHLARWQSIAIGTALVLLVAALTVPTTLDTVRAEQAALQRTVDQELSQLAQLRAEVVARPGLTDADRKAIVSQLDNISSSLSVPSLDRSGMLAALSDAQQQLQQLSPQTSADFNNIIAAAHTVEQSMLDVSQNRAGGTIDVTWSPSDFPGQSDLAIAANAATTLGAQNRFLTSGLTQSTIGQLSRASSQAGADDADLSQHLMDASTAIGVKDVAKAKDALQQSALAFLADDKNLQKAQAVDKIMSNLDQGRQTLADLGAQDVKKAQVGFRRPASPNASQVAPGGTPSTAAQSNGQDTQNSTSSSSGAPSALGPQLNGSSPDYNSFKSGQTGNGGSTSQGGNQANSQQSNGSGGQQGSQSAGGGQASGDGSQGTLTGPITGPVGGGAGAISQVANPAGQGVSTGSQPSQASANPQADSIYVPPADANAASNNPGGSSDQNAPVPQPNALAGRSANGGDGATTLSDPGEGSRNQIHTPYQQVIGNYVQQATQALDSVFIPADAKDYVKNYFTALGK